MFTTSDINLINKSYFKTIKVNAYAVTLLSRNTKHYWHIIAQDYSTCSAYVIYHRTIDYGEYHYQCSRATFATCLRYIKGHDRYIKNEKKKKNKR